LKCSRSITACFKIKVGCERLAQKLNCKEIADIVRFAAVVAGALTKQLESLPAFTAF
jgi:hypothetical protein